MFKVKSCEYRQHMGLVGLLVCWVVLGSDRRVKQPGVYLQKCVLSKPLQRVLSE